jgi:hypothetical protein
MGDTVPFLLSRGENLYCDFYLITPLAAVAMDFQPYPERFKDTIDFRDHGVVKETECGLWIHATYY